MQIVYESSKDKYSRLNKLGEGAQATAFLVERLSDNKKFVVKINRDFQFTKNQMDEAKRLEKY